MSLKSKLQRMKGHLVKDTDKPASLSAESAVTGAKAEANAPAEAMHKQAGATHASAEAMHKQVEATNESADAMHKQAGATHEPAVHEVPGEQQHQPQHQHQQAGLPGAGHPEVELPYADRWKELQATPYIWEDEHVMIREVRYPIGRRHGAYAFSELLDAIATWESSGKEHPLSTAGRRPEDLLFFDTETTGLSGGAGNTVFLLGYSRIEGNEVVVRQHFLPAPHAEVTLYQSFLEQAEKSSHLVTFNGKSFDWPQVRTRHTLIRDQVPALPAFGHFDLLHGARRLWKAELESCRLGIIEQEKLDVFREDDLPGYLAPIRYFDFLHSQDPDVIEGVLRHNETDVLSLITLYIHMTRLLLQHEREAVSHEERFEIARWYEVLGDQAAAMDGYRLVAKSNHSWRNRARLAIGHLYKKQREYQQALHVWESCMESSAYVPEEVYIEAAKLCEHQFKDWEKALKYTRQAYEQWKKRGSLLRNRSKAEGLAYQKRIDRLEAKGRGSGADEDGLISGLFDWPDDKPSV